MGTPWTALLTPPAAPCSTSAPAAWTSYRRTSGRARGEQLARTHTRTHSHTRTLTRSRAHTHAHTRTLTRSRAHTRACPQTPRSCWLFPGILSCSVNAGLSLKNAPVVVRRSGPSFALLCKEYGPCRLYIAAALHSLWFTYQTNVSLGPIPLCRSNKPSLDFLCISLFFM